MRNYQIKVPEDKVAIIEKLLKELNIPFSLSDDNIENQELTEDIQKMLDQRLSEPASNYYSVDEMLKRQNERYKL